MEHTSMGAFFDGEIESLCNIFTMDEPNFGAEFFGHSTSSFVSPCTDNNEFFYYDPSNCLPPIYQNNLPYHHSDNSSDTTSYSLPSQTTRSCQKSHFSLPNDAFFPMNNISMMEQGSLSLFTSAFPTVVNVDGSSSSQVGFVEDNESDNLRSPQDDSELELKRKHTAPDLEAEEKLKGAPKKKVRVSKDRGKKSIESKQNDEEDENKMGEKDNSDDESKVCEQISEGENSASKELIVVTSKGKKRANRGSATDPQSLYARRRREKINERLKILQNLVPNGTKVDISTMLEEAVQYVKFLQLQIRLLSSDDFWMYAPIAYNGVDISLYKRISPFLLA